MNNNNNNDPAEGPGNGHTVTRILQVLTLIPCWALLAAVIDSYNSADADTPGEIQFLFVIAILATVWSFCILITYLRAKNTALWMTFFDVVALALFIAAVVVLSDIANNECNVVGGITVINNPDDNIVYYPADYRNPGTRRWLLKRQGVIVDPDLVRTDGEYTYRQHCGEIKGAWGLAIANIILFFISAILTVVIYKNAQTPIVREKIIIDPPMQQTMPPPMMQQPPPMMQQPPPVYGDPFAGGAAPPPRRHSRKHSKSHRDGRSRSHRSDRGGSTYYEGSRQGSRRGSRSEYDDRRY